MAKKRRKVDETHGREGAPMWLNGHQRRFEEPFVRIWLIYEDVEACAADFSGLEGGDLSKPRRKLFERWKEMVSESVQVQYKEKEH